jgi:hypothetical protein
MSKKIYREACPEPVEGTQSTQKIKNKKLCVLCVFAVQKSFLVAACPR